MYSGSTYGAIFGAPGTGNKIRTANLAVPTPPGMQDFIFQFWSARQHCTPEIPTVQSGADSLGANLSSIVIHQEAVSLPVIAALPDSFPNVVDLFRREPW